RDAHRYGLIEAIASETIVQVRAAERRQPCFIQLFLYIFDGGTVENRCGIGAAELVARPPKNGLEDLPQVHPRGYTQRIETDVDRRAVFQEGHIFFAHDTRDNTLVSVTSGHLIADLQLALLGNIHLGKLDDPGREFVTHFQGEAFALEFPGVRIAFPQVDLHHLGYQVIGMVVGSPVVERHVGDQVHLFRNVVIAFVPADVFIGEKARLNNLVGELHAFGNKFVAKFVTDAIAGLSIQEDTKFLDQFIPELGELLAVTCLQRIQFLLGTRADILFALGSREELRVNYYALQRRRRPQRSILHVAGLVAKDRAKQFLFRSRVGLPFRSDLSDEDVTFLDFGAYTDDAVFIDVRHSFVSDVRSFRCKFVL